MIWFKKEEKLIGCVPLLSKEYNSNEIRNMSNNSARRISSLSEFVMQIQAISYSYFREGEHYKRPTANSLMNVSLDISKWECFSITSDDERKKAYVDDIFEVFEKLSLYKVKELEIEEVKNTIKFLTDDIKGFNDSLKYLLKVEIEESLNRKLEETINNAESNTEYLEKLKVLFKENDKVLTNPIFKEPDENVLLYAEQERNVKYDIFYGTY